MDLLAGTKCAMTGQNVASFETNLGSQDNMSADSHSASRGDMLSNLFWATA